MLLREGSDATVVTKGRDNKASDNGRGGAKAVAGVSGNKGAGRLLSRMSSNQKHEEVALLLIDLVGASLSASKGEEAAIQVDLL